MASSKRTVVSLSKVGVKQTLDQGVWQRDLVMESLLDSATFGDEIYVNSQDQLLIRFPKGNGRLHASRASMLKILTEYENRGHRPKHLLEGILLHNAEFAQHLYELIADASRLLRLNVADLDWSEQSLKLLARKCEDVGYPRCLEATIFSGLVAYLSEFMRRQINGFIILHEVKTVGSLPVWEPWIVDQQNRSCQCWSQLYTRFVEEQHPLSFSFIYVELNARRIQSFTQ